MKKILVVDDDEKVRNLLVRFLSGLGYQLQSAADGDAALAQLEKERPDTLLLDLVMPGASGLEVLRGARQLYPDLPVIILSGQADEELARQALKAGAYDFFLKPFDLKAVEEHLSTKLGLLELEGEAGAR